MLGLVLGPQMLDVSAGANPNDSKQRFRVNFPLLWAPFQGLNVKSSRGLAMVADVSTHLHSETLTVNTPTRGASGIFGSEAMK